VSQQPPGQSLLGVSKTVPCPKGHARNYGLAHEGTGGLEKCTHCEELAKAARTMNQPLSFSVSNLPEGSGDEFLVSLLKDAKGVSVGNACATSGRLDLVYASAFADINSIRATLTKSGVNVDGLILNMQIESAITPESKQQLEGRLEALGDVTLRNVSGNGSLLEFLSTGAETQRGEIARALQQTGHKLKPPTPQAGLF